MNGLYYNLVKKSIPAIILGVFLFSSLPVYALTPNDEQYNKQQPVWQQIGAEKAWDYNTGSKRVTVAIIDTGADIWNDDIEANIWTNPYEISGNGFDDDNNGYVDDVHGWNFIENNNNVRTSVLDNVSDPDAISHGTLIAGLVGAVGNNKKSGTGMNWQVQIMPLRAVDSSGGGYLSNVVKAVRYAIDNGADVISLSVVGDQTDSRIRNILYEAYKKGIVVVAAAGNGQVAGDGDLDKKPLYPVCLDQGQEENWILGVSSVDNGDHLSKFANYGGCVDLVAPGQNIYSTERYAPLYGFLNEFGGPWQGTSFAVPLVAGAAALLKAQRPDWGAKEIIATLLANADNVDVQNPKFKGKLGYGRLNIGRAMEVAAAVSIPVSMDVHQKYSFKGRIIYVKDNNNKKTIFSSVSGVQIVSLASVKSFNYKRDEILVLVKRGKNYFVQFFTDSGQKWKEVSVPLSDYSANKQPTEINIEVVDGQRKVSLNFLEKIVKKGKKTVTETTSKEYPWLD